MHHKRKGSKSIRAGCLMCKPQKRQGQRLHARQRFSQTRRLIGARQEIRDAGAGPRF
jgi:hypothetical protein